MAIERTAMSPAGDPISLVGDEVWMKRTKTTKQGMRAWNAGTKRLVIAALWEHGPFTDHPDGTNGAGGLALRKLTEWMQANYGVAVTNSAITTMMIQPVNRPAFIREGNSKRTRSVALVSLPESWYVKLTDTLTNEVPVLRAARGVAAPVVAPVDPVPDSDPLAATEAPETAGDWLASESPAEPLALAPALADDGPPPIDLAISQSVAMSLLTTVVEIIHAGTPGNVDARIAQLKRDLADVEINLGKRLDENQTMRRHMRDLGDELKAVKFERDGLRQRVHRAEANLKEMMNGDQAKMVDAEVRRRIDSFMRAAPTNPKVKDSA